MGIEINKNLLYNQIFTNGVTFNMRSTNKLLFSDYLKSKNMEYLVQIAPKFGLKFNDIEILAKTDKRLFLDQVLKQSFFRKLYRTQKQKLIERFNLLIQNKEIEARLLKYVLNDADVEFSHKPNRSRLIRSCLEKQLMLLSRPTGSEHHLLEQNDSAPKGVKFGTTQQEGKEFSNFML